MINLSVETTARQGTEEGTTEGLIRVLISLAKQTLARNLTHPAVAEALRDLRECAELAQLLAENRPGVARG